MKQCVLSWSGESRLTCDQTLWSTRSRENWNKIEVI